MFTEGLDENAIKWIQQGSDLDPPEQPPRVRSPLAERFTADHFPRSPSLLFSSNSSNHALPPLKFHSGLLAPHMAAPPPCLSSDMDVDDEDEESVDSVSDGFSEANFSDEESKGQSEWGVEEEEEEVFKSRCGGLNKRVFEGGFKG